MIFLHNYFFALFLALPFLALLFLDPAFLADFLPPFLALLAFFGAAAGAGAAVVVAGAAVVVAGAAVVAFLVEDLACFLALPVFLAVFLTAFFTGVLLVPAAFLVLWTLFALEWALLPAVFLTALDVFLFAALFFFEALLFPLLTALASKINKLGSFRIHDFRTNQVAGKLKQMENKYFTRICSYFRCRSTIACSTGIHCFTFDEGMTHANCKFYINLLGICLFLLNNY